MAARSTRVAIFFGFDVSLQKRVAKNFAYFWQSLKRTVYVFSQNNDNGGDCLAHHLCD